MRRGQGDAGGYGFRDSGDGQGGVWTRSEEAAEAARRAARQQEAAASALAAMEARIAGIRDDPTLTDQEKLVALRRLTASGYSEAEFAVLREAQELG